jgi:hypothetical protein
VNRGLYAIALAVVGLVALGVPAFTLLVAALALACPLMMMMFVMAGMHGGHSDTDRTAAHHGPAPDHRQDEPTTGRR